MRAVVIAAGELGVEVLLLWVRIGLRGVWGRRCVLDVCGRRFALEWLCGVVRLVQQSLLLLLLLLLLLQVLLVLLMLRTH